MDNLNATARSLVEHYLDQTCTDKEKELVEDWYESLPKANKAIGEAEMEHDLHLVQHKLWQQRHPQRLFSLWRKVAAAAIVVLLLGGAAYYYLDNRPETVYDKQLVSHDIDPGDYRATLILDGGRKISLKDAGAGRLAWVDGVQISKTADGQLVYQVREPSVAHTDNLIEVPRGGEYQVVLPDGSHVWLNAGSSLKYPTRFTGMTRRVELHGEAYFEVSHQSATANHQTKRPFVVATAHQEIEVLGTHFNVSAYADDIMTKTTLLEGKVRVMAGKGNQQKAVTLKPGEQATLTGEDFQVAQADIEEVIAWQRGYIVGHSMTFDQLLKKLSRWYDFEYKGSYNGGMLYTINICRKMKLSTVLQSIELTNRRITFQIENKGGKDGRKVYIKTLQN